MDRFYEAYRRTLWYEGGTNQITADHGGATYMGISKRFLESVGDTRDPRDLTDVEVIDLYDKHFWTPMHCEEIHSDLVAFKVYDIAVNMGVHTASVMLQICVNDLLRHEYGSSLIDEDGVIGPKTIKAVNELKDYELLYWLREEQEDRYHVIASRDETQMVFLTGWLRRAQW
jgi:lysozyme family protein